MSQFDAAVTIRVGRYGMYLELDFGSKDGENVAVLSCDDWGKWKLDAEDMQNGPMKDRLLGFLEHTRTEIERLRARANEPVEEPVAE